MVTSEGIKQFFISIKEFLKNQYPDPKDIELEYDKISGLKDQEHVKIVDLLSSKYYTLLTIGVVRNGLNDGFKALIFWLCWVALLDTLAAYL